MQEGVGVDKSWQNCKGSGEGSRRHRLPRFGGSRAKPVETATSSLSATRCARVPDFFRIWPGTATHARLLSLAIAGDLSPRNFAFARVALQKLRCVYRFR